MIDKRFVKINFVSGIVFQEKKIRECFQAPAMIRFLSFKVFYFLYYLVCST